MTTNFEDPTYLRGKAQGLDDAAYILRAFPIARAGSKADRELWETIKMLQKTAADLRHCADTGKPLAEVF